MNRTFKREWQKNQTQLQYYYADLTGGKYHIFENIKNMKNIKIFFDIFDNFDIFKNMKIPNKLYNNGCNTLMQYLMSISYLSFVPYVKT